jgi:RNA polymerase sigma-70 factor (ECF subfamily)
MLQITRNESRRLLARRRRREQATDADPASCAPELEDDEFASATTRLAVEQALARLEAGDQRVLRLRYRDDLTQADVARRLGVPEGTVKVRLHRARGRLRMLLEDGR